MTPALVVCGHGTRDPAGRAAVSACVADVAARLPGVDVHEAYVDVHGPEVGDVVAAVPGSGDGGPAAVVVPLLLAAGYHVHVDLAEVVQGRPDVLLTPALGPDDRIVDLVVDRLGEGAGVADAVVLAPAGSSDERARADSREVGDRLAARLGRSVRVGYAAGSPSAADEVAAARAAGAGRVVVASYLLAPGFFQRRLTQAGADAVTGPLLPDPRVVDVVVDRYRTALA